jgi:predicted ATP-grasp superfamily ATP-dependent carboligase
MNIALIVCFDNWNTLSEVPYILNKGGFEVHVLCGEKSWLLNNKFYHKWIVAEGKTSAFVEQLTGLAKTGDYDWIIPGDEKIIKLLNETIEDEALFYKLLPLTKIENRELLSSKTGLSNVCNKYNVRTPGYINYHVQKNIKPSLQPLKFPLILKVDFSWGGVGLKVFNSFDEVQTTLTKIPEGETMIIQEYIKGHEVPIEALFWKGKLIAISCSEILEYDKDEFSYSTRRRYFPVDSTLREEVAFFGESVGIHGFVNMAYIKSAANGLHYLIEADTRPSSWSAYAEYSGNSFSKALKSITTATEVATPTNCQNVEIALFHKDIRRGLYKHDVKGLLRWVFKPGYWKYIPFYDHKLFWHTFKEIWSEFVIDKMHRTFNSKRDHVR